VTLSVQSSAADHIKTASDNDLANGVKRRTIMKTIILSTLLALSVLTGVVGSASAADPERGVYGQFSTGQGS
jgi:hypothetical protein